MEVSSPKSLYELVIKAEIGNGTAVPRGRVNLPREAKPRGEDKVLVFAEGRLADEARKAGAHIVGGPELIEGVCHVAFCLSRLTTIGAQQSPSSYDYPVHPSTHKNYYSKTWTLSWSTWSYALRTSWHRDGGYCRLHSASTGDKRVESR